MSATSNYMVSRRERLCPLNVDSGQIGASRLRKYRSSRDCLARLKSSEAEVATRLPSWLRPTQDELCEQPRGGCGTPYRQRRRAYAKRPRVSVSIKRFLASKGDWLPGGRLRERRA